MCYKVRCCDKAELSLPQRIYLARVSSRGCYGGGVMEGVFRGGSVRRGGDREGPGFQGAGVLAGGVIGRG